MNEDKIAEYRAEAAVCISRAEMDTNKTTVLKWRSLAEEWTRKADELERKLNPPNSGN